MTEQPLPNDDASEEAVTTPVAKMVAPAWPRDPYGITSSLRREIARVVGRLNGDPQKFEIFMQHLREGAVWGQKRMEIQTRQKQVLIAAQAEADARAAEEQEKANADLDLATDEERAAAQRAAGIQGAVYSTSK